MKHFLLFFSLLFPPLLHAQVQLTLRVNMGQQTVSPDGVHVAGSFQTAAGYASNWDPASTPLTDTDNDNIYEVTLTVPAGLYHYKFINGNSWTDMPETSLTPCGVDDGSGNLNREVSVGSTDLRLPVVAFDGCNTQLVFSVNMSRETVPASGVHVAGNWQALAGYGSDWQPAATPMHDPDGDGTYVARISLPAPGLYQYKYIGGNSWTQAEQVPAECGQDDGSGNMNRVAEAIADINMTPAYCFGSCEVCGASGLPPTDYPTYWWNESVFYEIFVRSFYDSNGDGIGDFRGLTQKLDYLNDGQPNTTTDLGITGIWLMPMMKSPSYHGYDVTDYYAVEPDYGTMADFEAFLAAAHSRGIRVIIDFVMNHTSDQHPWFTQSASSSSNAYRDWYIWSDTDPGFQGPWGQQVWHPRNGDYYYALFWGGMPDLNWSNPEVKNEMWDITRFWLNKGVDGYRLDAVKYLDEDGTMLENTPETFAILEEFNQVYKAADPDAFTVGEIWSNTASVVPYVRGSRLDAAFEFDLSYALINSVRSNDPTSLRNQLNVVTRAYPSLQYATFLTNHDQNRVLNELEGNIDHMKQAATLYLTMPGIPFLYYGEEVGMVGTKPDENIRRPMQWAPGSQAGFTTSTPWIGLNPNFADFNVQVMEGDHNSLLTHYKRLIRLRQRTPALTKGYYLPVETGHEDVLSYARVWEQEAVVVVSNFGSGIVASPDLSVAISTLQPGTYNATELYSGSPLGTITVEEGGAVSNWSPANASLAADESWIILISQGSEFPTGLQEEQEMLDVQLYPNPGSSLVNIQLKEVYKKDNQLKVYDLSGRLLQQLIFSGSSYQLDISSLTKGTYFINIRSGSTSTTKRLVIVR